MCAIVLGLRLLMLLRLLVLELLVLRLLVSLWLVLRLLLLHGGLRRGEQWGVRRPARLPPLLLLRRGQGAVQQFRWT